MVSSKSLLVTCAVAGILSAIDSPTNAAVTPGGTFTDKAVFREAAGGETLTRAASAGALGPVLVHDFDTTVAIDPTYELVAPSQIALSSGRHLVMYSSRFDGISTPPTVNRIEILTNLSLAGSPIAAGRSQGFIRGITGADETVTSGGAIITVAADDDILTLESLRSDINAANTPTRVADHTAIQLLKLEDSWDFLSLERGANQAGTVGTGGADVTYDTDNSPGTLGTAFSFTPTSGDITLNETGLYLVFANTGLANTVTVAATRTSYVQTLTLDNVVVPGSRTNTYIRGDGNAEDAKNGVASVGMIVSATAGQTLNVNVTMESGGFAGTIQGGQTAITVVKLPLTAKYIELTDTTNQNILDATVDVIGFNTQVSPSNAEFTHAGGSTVTVNAAGDYLFLSSLSTETDATNDNNDRAIPIHGWQIDQTGGAISRGFGSSYNRDNVGNRISGSWSGTLLELTAGQTVEMTNQDVGQTPGGTDPILPNIPTMQGLNIASLVVTNDPAVAVNLPLTVVPGSTGNVISDAVLDTFDNDTPPSGLTYTVDSAPAGGTLRKSGGALGMGGTFTQEDIDNSLITFDAAGSETVGGFDFNVSDGTASDISTFVINVVYPTITVSIASAGDVAEGGVTSFNVTADVAPDGANATVTVAYSGSAVNGTDFTGSTTVDIVDGATTASISITALTDGLFEGAEAVTATITDVSGATVNGAIGSPSSANLLISDAGNNTPIVTNLTQVSAGTGNVAIKDIIVTESDADYDSTVTTAGTPLFRTNGITNETVFSDGRPNDDTSFDVDAGGNPALSEAAGFSIEIAFIPQSDDLTGVVDLWEIGGSSNGSVILLVDGVPHLLSKAGGAPADAPTDDMTVPGAFTDLNWATDDTIVVPLNGANVLTAGLPARIAVVYDIAGNTVKSSVNGSAEATATLLNNDATNWIGDHTVNTGTNAGSGTGGSSTPTGLALQSTLKNLAGGFGSVSSVRFWNESTGSTTPTSGTADIVTATLSISGWSSAANGTLTTTSGNGETFVGGVWSVTGDVVAVNAALAAVEFVTGGSTADPTIVAVSVDDGNEDGSGPATGSIVVTATAPDPVYVDDDFSGSIGDPIADADGGPPVAPAILGLSAFTNLTDALAAVSPTGTIIVNDGDYSTENITLADSVALQLTATAGPVQIGNLGSGETNSIVLEGSNTLEVGALNLSAPGVNSAISGTGNLTKVGTGTFIVRQINTYTGTTAVLDGFYRVGFVSGLGLQSELAGDGPVVVTSPGRLELNVDIDKTINQTGAISGDGSVGTLGDGTVIFDGAGANTFSGGFELGDGASSTFDGVSGAKEGFVIVNHNGHLGTGKILSRGGQLQAGTPGIIIPNDMDITQGGLRCGGAFDFTFSGNLNPTGNTNRAYANYGLEGRNLTITGNINLDDGNIVVEGTDGADNGTWTFTGDISGTGNILIQTFFDDGDATFSGTNTYAGTTTFRSGTTHYNGTHTGGGAYLVQDGSAVLAGTGSTDAAVTVNNGTTLNPGGIGTAGIFTTGDLTINGTLEVDLDNNTPGTGHDQVIANGAVTLGATSSLVTNAGAGLTPGTLTLIDNDDAADAVTGAFAGLPQGGAVDPLALGFDATLDYTAGGGDTNDVAIAFTGYTVIGQWRADFFGNPANSGLGEDSATGSNGLTNLQSFAFDLDPTAPAGTLNVSGGSILSLGPPKVWIDPATSRIYLQHTRRSDFAAIPLTITDQFSRDLTAFEDSAVAPTVIATGTGGSGSAIEAVQTEFPLVLPISGGKGRFAQVEVTTP